MSLVSRVLGPESKYDEKLPFTYEARVPIPGAGMTQSYIADTLCGVLDRLASEGIAPSEATIREVRPDGEVPILIEHCVGPDGRWLKRPAACRSFEQHYAGHEGHGQCCYRDRTRTAEGPFVEVDAEDPALRKQPSR